MALGDPYVDLPAMKVYTKVPADNSTLNDVLESAIQSASSDVEKFCQRQFNRTEEASSRVYTPLTRYVVNVDDFWTTDDLVVAVDSNGDNTFSTVLSSAEYQLYPLNGISDGQPGWPYNKVKLTGLASVMFPWGYASVRVTAKWGWEAVPDSVKQATLLLANELFAMKGAPLGVAGSNQYGEIRVRENKLTWNKLRRYINNPILIG